MHHLLIFTTSRIRHQATKFITFQTCSLNFELTCLVSTSVHEKGLRDLVGKEICTVRVHTQKLTLCCSCGTIFPELCSISFRHWRQFWQQTKIRPCTCRKCSKYYLQTGTEQFSFKTHTTLNDMFMCVIQADDSDMNSCVTVKKRRLITHQSSMTISGWNSSSSSSHRPSAFRSTTCSVENQLRTQKDDRTQTWPQTHKWLLEICMYKYAKSQKVRPVSCQLTHHSTYGDVTGIIREDVIAGGPVTKVTCEVRVLKMYPNIVKRMAWSTAWAILYKNKILIICYERLIFG